MIDIKEKIADIICDENKHQDAVDRIAALFPQWKPFDTNNPETWPDDCIPYLIIAKNRADKISPNIMGSIDKWTKQERWLCKGKNVIAYMELPEPYKGK